MSRKPLRGDTFQGAVDRKFDGPLLLNGRPVGRVAFRVAYYLAFANQLPQGRRAVARSSAMRGRKRASDARRALKGCDHEFEYHEDVIGDYGVVNGTFTERWLECICCGAKRPADYDDAPDDGDFY